MELLRDVLEDVVLILSSRAAGWGGGCTQKY